MLMKRNMVAFDCGNSSCRVILGVYDGEQITTEVISRIPNYMVRVHQYFYWDLPKIIRGVKRGGKAGRNHPLNRYLYMGSGFCTV